MLTELTIEPRIVELPEGKCWVWSVRPDLVFTRAEGRMALAHARLIMDTVDAAVRACPGKATAVHDWTSVKSYELGVQAQMATWGLSVTRQMRRVVIGVKSPLVSVAVRAANLAVGGRYELLSSREQVLEVARQELKLEAEQGVR